MKDNNDSNNDEFPCSEVEEMVSYYNEVSVKYSAEISSICRQLAFTEGAIIWVFFLYLNISNITLLWSFLFVVLFFIFDFCQYMAGYLKYKDIADRFETKLNEKNYEKKQYTFPNIKIDFVFVFFCLKLLFLGLLSGIIIMQFIVQLYCDC